MLQKFIQIVRPNPVRAPTLPQHLDHRPYSSAAVNQLYNNLFCSDTRAVSPRHGERLNGQAAVPRRQLHGLIVEMRFATGLDVLAVFADGTVRYVDESGEPVVCDSNALPMRCIAMRLLGHAQLVLRRIRTSGQQRKAPPARGHVRLSFLASDGLYVDDGPLSLMRHEPEAGRLIKHADELRQLAAQAAEGRRPVRLHDVVLARAA